MDTKNAAKRTREFFIDNERPLTLSEIKAGTGLASSAISMSLAYLMRQKYLTRQEIANPLPFGRRKVWQYTYYHQRQL